MIKELNSIADISQRDFERINLSIDDEITNFITDNKSDFLNGCFVALDIILSDGEMVNLWVEYTAKVNYPIADISINKLTAYTGDMPDLILDRYNAKLNDNRS